MATEKMTRTEFEQLCKAHIFIEYGHVFPEIEYHEMIVDCLKDLLKNFLEYYSRFNMEIYHKFEVEAKIAFEVIYKYVQEEKEKEKHYRYDVDEKTIRKNDYHRIYQYNDYLLNNLFYSCKNGMVWADDFGKLHEYEEYQTKDGRIYWKVPAENKTIKIYLITLLNHGDEWVNFNEPEMFYEKRAMLERIRDETPIEMDE